MKNAHLILTVDYELFGDGTGCLEHCVLHPAERLMRVAERFDAPLTMFAEALEFIALADRVDDYRASHQLRQCLAHGHDVQLHLHPQWQAAEVDSGGRWNLDLSRWRIADLPFEEIAGLLSQGKQWLENEIAANVSGYRCEAFRAGGWCIQPSGNVVKVLLDLGFKVDSSVAPGQWRPSRGEWSDFRRAPALPCWKTEGDVCIPASHGLWELPIIVGNIGRMGHFKSLLASRRMPNAGLAPECVGSYRGPDACRGANLLSKATRLSQIGKVMLDLSTMSKEHLIEITQQWLGRYGNNGAAIPLVAIAHTKNFTDYSEQAMAGYLEWARDSGIRFSTFGQWVANDTKVKVAQ